MNENSSAVRFFYGTHPGRFLLKKLLVSRADRLCVKFLCSHASCFLVRWYANRHGIALKPEDRYATFRDFFVRPKPGISRVDLTPGHLTSPCDGWLSVYPIEPEGTFHIKGSDYRLCDFLNKQIINETDYKGGLCLVFRLCASDYHHYCYIDDGYQGANHYIPGELHSVQPLACETYPVYTLNRRVWTLLTTENFGPVIQTAVGALIVGGIVNERENCRVRRGAEMGHFELAGSTIVLLFQRGRLSLTPFVKGQTASGRELRVEQGLLLGKAEKTRCETLSSTPRHPGEGQTASCADDCP